VADEIFDPEIHASDPKTGEPSLNKDGSFRKKRRDAGARKTAAPKPSGGSGNSARERYRKNVDQVLGIPVTLLSIKDPVLGYACGELAPMWSAGLADLAMDYPQLAAALEKSGNLGSAGALLGAALLTGVQLGHLLGKVPAHMVKLMGGRTREEIEQILQQRGVELAEQSQRQAAEDAEDAAEAEAINRLVMEGRQGGPREHVHV
jgi:hypothetical protein